MLGIAQPLFAEIAPVRLDVGRGATRTTYDHVSPQYCH